MKILTHIRGPADAAIALERRLLDSLARPSSDYVGTDVIAEIHSALRSLQGAHPNVVIDVHVTPVAFEVACSSDSLRFVFSNLFDNAVAAMKGVGRLTISEHSFGDDNTLVIDITDTGHGIPPDKQKKIWEAYYSDDGTGRGKGLASDCGSYRTTWKK